MLVLSRREGEKIIIGDSITITIVRTSGDKVRVGIDAPDDILVLRGELEVHNEGRRVPGNAAPTQQRISKPAA
jgi:carbon storage regulator